MQLEFEANDNREKYKMEGIQDSTVYIKNSESDYLPRLYYLVSWKSYPKEENSQKPALAI